MKIIPFALLALIILSTGCIPPPQASTTPNAEIMALREENARLRRMASVRRMSPRVRMPAPAPDVAAPAPTPPALTPPVTNGNGYVSGSMVVRGEYNVYPGAIGTEPRQVTIGRKLKLVNHVCDRGSRDGGLNCSDKDNDGYKDFNSALAFEIEGKPVVCGRQGMLFPNQTCFVEIGRNREVKLMVKKHRFLNTHSRPMLDPQPDASYTVTINLGHQNITHYAVNELNF